MAKDTLSLCINANFIAEGLEVFAEYKRDLATASIAVGVVKVGRDRMSRWAESDATAAGCIRGLVAEIERLRRLAPGDPGGGRGVDATMFDDAGWKARAEEAERRLADALHAVDSAMEQAGPDWDAYFNQDEDAPRLTLDEMMVIDWIDDLRLIREILAPEDSDESPDPAPARPAGR